MGSQRSVSVERVIAAPADEIFAVLDDPSKHHVIDGSGTVVGARTEATHLQLGDRFGMDMKLGVPYRMQSTVVEYEKDRLIAWAHFGRHRWRYELEPMDDGRTRVVETFDWSTAIVPKLIELLGYPRRHPTNMAATLERLADHVED